MKYYIALFLLLHILLFHNGHMCAGRTGGRGSSRGSSSRGSSSRGSSSRGSWSRSSSSGHSSSSSSHYSPGSNSGGTATSSHSSSAIGKSASSDFIKKESASVQHSPNYGDRATSGFPSHTGSSKHEVSAPPEKPAWANPFHPDSTISQPLNRDKPAWANPFYTGTPSHTSLPGEKPAWANPFYTGTPSRTSLPGEKPEWANPFHIDIPGHTSLNKDKPIWNTPVGKPLQSNPNAGGTSHMPSSSWNNHHRPTSSHHAYRSHHNATDKGVTHTESGLPTRHFSGNAASPPYPVTGGMSMPQPTNVNSGNIGFKPSVTHPLNSQPVGSSVYHPPPIGSHSFTPNYPSYHPTMGHPGFASSAGHYPYNPSTGGVPLYQPAPPSSGPIVVMAGQPSSGGRGLGQIIAEAAVFSAVNAGVNRLLSPHHHHYPSESMSQPTGSTTHITYNNYINGQPVDGNPNIGSIPMPNNSPGTPFTNTVNFPNTGGSSFSATNPVSMTNPSSTSYNPGVNNLPANSGSVSNIPPPGVVTNVGPSNNANVANNPYINDGNVTIYGISNSEIWKLTEDLFAKQEFNVTEFITLNLQKKSNDTNDVAPKPLFVIQKEAYVLPTVRALWELYGHYESDSRVRENRTQEKRQKENVLLDTFMNTDVMSTALRWLSDKLFIDPDDFEKKDTLHHIWFNIFDGTSSGFERVFISETIHTENTAVILGIQDWISFGYLESAKRINYLGYVDKVDLGNKASLVKLHYKMNDLVVSNTTVFVGTLPELEMALYTVCFYARPGLECSVSLGGTKVNVYTHLMPYFGKYLLVAAYPSLS